MSSPRKSAGDPRRREIDEKALAWMREGLGTHDEDRFDALAREIFEFQFAQCAPYARFCSARGVAPGSVTHWSEIPAVPTGAFKEAPLRSFPAELTRGIFRTSGTSTHHPGELHLDTFELYEASLLPMIERYVFPDVAAVQSAEHTGRQLPEANAGQRSIAIRVLASPPSEAPHSSLSHMFACAIDAFGSPQSGYDSRDGVLQAESLLDRLRDLARTGEPVALCGTSFAFVHLLEAMGEGTATPLQVELPPGSRIMETGGFKGRSREVARNDLYRALEFHLAVPQHHIVNQYGMTELGSQFYDSTLFEESSLEAAGPRRKLGPPWARVRIVDPESGREAKSGEVGMIVIHDLANTGSIAAIETADLGRRIGGRGVGPDAVGGRDDVDGGFEILGRFAGAEERGCSIAVDAMWQGDDR